jgi:hypothetical protein
LVNKWYKVDFRVVWFRTEIKKTKDKFTNNFLGTKREGGSKLMKRLKKNKTFIRDWARRWEKWGGIFLSSFV